MTKTDIHADLAYVRELAEAGHQAPLLGGRFLIWWGGLASLTLLTHWGIWVRAIPIDPVFLAPLWFGFGIVGSIGQALLGRSIRAKPGVGSAGNRTESAVWLSMGLTTFAYFLAVMAGVALGQLSSAFYNTIVPIALLGYASAWLSTAQIQRSWLTAAPGIIALIGMIAAIPFVMTASLYLIAAATAFGSTVLPGLLMMRGEPKDLV